MIVVLVHYFTSPVQCTTCVCVWGIIIMLTLLAESSSDWSDEDASGDSARARRRDAPRARPVALFSATRRTGRRTGSCNSNLLRASAGTTTGGSSPNKPSLVWNFQETSGSTVCVYVCVCVCVVCVCVVCVCVYTQRYAHILKARVHLPMHLRQ